MGTMDATTANAGIAAIGALVDAGTGEFQDASNTEVATVTFSNPAISGSPASGVATFDTITGDSACAGGGPITKFVFKTSGAAARFKGTVSESGGGGEITIDNDSPAAGVSVLMTSLTIALAVGTVP